MKNMMIALAIEKDERREVQTEDLTPFNIQQILPNT